MTGKGGGATLLAGDSFSLGDALGLVESALQTDTFVFGGNLTWVVALIRGGGGGLIGETCFGGRGGGRRTIWEGSAGVSFKGESERGLTPESVWVTASGGALATDESITTIFPAPAFLTGRWAAGDGRRPVVPLEGKRGGGPLFGVGRLSAIVLSARVDAENRGGNAHRGACREQVTRHMDAINGFGQG